MTKLFTVILNGGLTSVFRDLIVGRLDVRKARRQAVISEQSSLKIYSLSWERVSEGQERVNTMLPTLSPSLIREGDNLVSLFTFHTSLKSKLAFTLAEVLITLGIIGVVAAMTMPALINNTQNKELQTALKKGYSEIMQAFELMKQDVGTEILPADYPIRTFAPVYKEYFKKVYYSSSAGMVSTDTDVETDYAALEVYKSYNGSRALVRNYFDDGQIILPDGALILIDNSSYNILISIDVNGIKKGPNIFGRDLFTFEITREGKLLPGGADGTSYIETKYCSKNSNDALNGIGCTVKALSDPNYFKRRY